VLRRLARHRVEGWALTGGLAIEIHLVLAGAGPQRRALNDIDFVAEEFADIPETLAGESSVRHIHPGEVPGRTNAQFVDAAAKLRIDVFEPTARATPVTLPEGKFKVLAVEPSAS